MPVYLVTITRAFRQYTQLQLIASDTQAAESRAQHCIAQVGDWLVWNEGTPEHSDLPRVADVRRESDGS